MDTVRTDCLVIGGGLAGCAYAHYASKLGLSVTLICPDELSVGTNSQWAQGGIIFDTTTRADQLENDIITASDFSANPDAVSSLVDNGQEAVRDFLLEVLDVPFDRDAAGSLKFTKEGGHSDKRIIFAKDVTGKEILKKVHAHILTLKNVHVMEHSIAVDLLTLSHNSERIQDKYRQSTCLGAYVLDTLTGDVNPVMAKKTILATGGLGQLYQNSTNQASMVGHGVAMAHRIGARLIDLEYVQFHPTVFLKKNCQLFLVSEAVRGEGGVLINGDGKAFMDTQHPMKSLAPRDIVARAIHRELISTGDSCVYIDLSSKSPDFIKERFPMIYERSLACGVDITKEPIPVAPAAHYSCGGVFADLNGRTSVRNLNAIGEAGCTGLHGANRLASTSLLECLVSARMASKSDLEDITSNEFYLPKVRQWESPSERADEVLIRQDMKLIRSTMWNYVGLIRSPKRLLRARKILMQLEEEISSFYSGCRLTRSLVELRNAVRSALLVVHAASLNPRSKGCHYITTEDDSLELVETRLEDEK